jgi:hypothetical protein
LWCSEAIKVNPQKLKDKWSDVRGKLVVIIKNYDQSGNGVSKKRDQDEGNNDDATFVDNTDC